MVESVPMWMKRKSPYQYGRAALVTKPTPTVSRMPVPMSRSCVRVTGRQGAGGAEGDDERGNGEAKDVQQVEGEEEAVGADMLPRQNAFGTVHPPRQQGSSSKQQRFRPEPLRIAEGLVCQRQHEGIRGRRGQGGSGEVGASQPQQGRALRLHGEHEQRPDPSQEGEGKEREGGVQAGEGIAGVHVHRRAEEEGEAQQVQRSREQGHTKEVEKER